MFKNVYYDIRKSTIHHWYTVKGERMYETQQWVPCVYVPHINGEYVGIDGKKLVKKEFRTYYEYNEFCKKNKGLCYESGVKPEIGFLTERYYGIEDDDLEVPELHVGSLDIEVYKPEGGFPEAYIAENEIVALTFYDVYNDKYVVFGSQEWENTLDKTVEYHCYPEERDRLKAFFKYVGHRGYDIITGWNVIQFDLHYIYNRAQLLNLSYELQQMSPVYKMTKWKKKGYSDDEKIKVNIDICGCTIIDYMDLYKNSTRHNHPSYKLDYISEFETGQGKLDYSHIANNLVELYQKDYKTYIDYNIIDTARVSDIDKKCNYINQVKYISLLSKCPMKFYESVTAVIEGLFLTYYRRNFLIGPPGPSGSTRDFMGAYVKDPQQGLHKWILSFDVTSEYPHMMIVCNMSFETYIGKIMGFPEQKIIECVRNSNFPEFKLATKTGIIDFKDKKLKAFNNLIKNKKYAVAPTGAIFDNNKEGVVPAVEKYVFGKRKYYKGLLNTARKNNDPNKDRYNSMQNALKIILNSIYGAITTNYFRLFNINIGEAITACGRHTILSTQKYVNDLLNNPNDVLLNVIKEINPNYKHINIHNDDFIAYIDTDSVYTQIGKFLENNNLIEDFDKLSLDKKIDIVHRIADILEERINDYSFNKTQLRDFNSNELEYKINLKRELIAPTGLFIKKKKYALWVLDQEGAKVDKLYIKGLDLIRSDCPEIVKDKLKIVMEKILKNEEESVIRKLVHQYEDDLLNATPSELAANVGISNIDKYKHGKYDYVKGTPWHVKGAINYNRLLHEYNLHNKYEQLVQGEKAKVVYLKKNKFGLETLAFTEWPKEIEEHGFICDKQKMNGKYFIKKIEMLLEPMNKVSMLNKNIDLIDDIFG